MKLKLEQAQRERRHNAEQEGKIKNLQIDIEHLIKERNQLQDRVRDLEEENTSTGEKGRNLQSDCEYYKRMHE